MKTGIYQTITDLKSCPTGIDWLMITAARHISRQNGNFQDSIGYTFKSTKPKHPMQIPLSIMAED